MDDSMFKRIKKAAELIIIYGDLAKGVYEAYSLDIKIPKPTKEAITRILQYVKHDNFSSEMA